MIVVWLVVICGAVSVGAAAATLAFGIIKKIEREELRSLVALNGWCSLLFAAMLAVVYYCVTVAELPK